MEMDALQPSGACRTCKKVGHYARDCPQNKKKTHGLKKDQAGPSGGRQQSTGRPDKTTLRCHHCNKIGHIKKECFKLKRERGLNAMPEVVDEEDEDFFICGLQETKSPFLGTAGRWPQL